MWASSAAPVRSGEREERYDILLSTLLTKLWRGVYLCNSCWTSFSRIRWDGGEVEVSEPFRYHHSPTVLSVRDRFVRSQTS